MEIKEQKGFTLIELLGAVVILGILATVGIVSVSKVLDKSHDKFDNNQYEVFLETAQTYFTDDKKRLPITPNEQREVTLQQLIDSKYLSELLDSNKNKFDYQKSRVVVTRLSTGKYKYEAELYRLTGQKIGSVTKGVVNENSSITFKLLDKEEYYHEGVIYYIKDIPKVEVTMIDSDKLVGYQYIIYKDGKQFKKSENIEISELNTYTDTIELGQEYPFGKYSIKVTVYDKNGNKTTKTSTSSTAGGTPGSGFTVFIDRIKPECSIKMDGVVGDNGWYRSSAVKLTLVEKDKESGILKHGLQTNNDFSSLTNLTSVTTLKESQGNTTGISWYGYVSDKAGNVCTSDTSNFRVDTDGPSCSIGSGSGKPIKSGWYNKYDYGEVAVLTLGCGDNGPSGTRGCGMSIQDEVTKEYIGGSNTASIATTEGVNIYYGGAVDYAGNSSSCRQTLMIDITDPLCPLIGQEIHKKNDPHRYPYNCNYHEDGTYETCYNEVPVSDDITFSWSGLSGDTESSYVDVKGGDQASQFPGAYAFIAGKENFKGSYSGELVAYDQAGNDAHCPPTNLVKKDSDGNPILDGEEEEEEDYSCSKMHDKFNELKDMYYNDRGDIVSENLFQGACGSANYCNERKICPEKVTSGEVSECPSYCSNASNKNTVECSNCLPCEVQYFNSSGQKVDRATYQKSCYGYSCNKVGNNDGTTTYYDKKGNKVDRKEYEKSCGDISCKVIDGIYYDSNGNEVSKSDYTKSCIGTEKHFCEIVDGKYYDINGNAVTEDSYNNSCNKDSSLKCPTITSNVSRQTWTKEEVTLTFSNFSEGTVSYDWYTNDKNDNFTKKSSNEVNIISKTLSADGKRKGKLVLFDASGNSKTCYTDRYFIDKTPPKCGEPSLETGNGRQINPDKWIKATTVKAEWTCIDKESGCTNEIFNAKKENLDEKEEKIKLKSDITDKAGNKTTCEVEVKVDNVPPKMNSCAKNPSGWKETGCYLKNPGSKSVLVPTITDEGSGYYGGYFDWLGGPSPQITKYPTLPKKKDECMATINEIDSFRYRNLCDEAGNCGPDEFKTVQCN